MIPDDEMKKLREDAKRNREKIASSGAFVSFFSKGCLDDPLVMMQLGMAIMMDKPILVVGTDDTEIPENLKRVATRVERVAERNSEELTDVFTRFLDDAAQT
jgi:hypothetical protein